MCVSHVTRLFIGELKNHHVNFDRNVPKMPPNNLKNIGKECVVKHSYLHIDTFQAVPSVKPTGLGVYLPRASIFLLLKSPELSPVVAELGLLESSLKNIRFQPGEVCPGFKEVLLKFSLFFFVCFFFAVSDKSPLLSVFATDRVKDTA